MAADIVKLEFKTREGTGKQAVKRLRAEGIAPGTIYGLGRDAVTISVETIVLHKIIQGTGGQGLIETTIDGGKPEPAMIVDVQRETITENILHFDMKRIDVSATDTFSVRIELIGEAEGMKAGGVLNALEDSVQIECLPTALPDKLVVDISELQIGEALFAGDIVLPEELKLMTDGKRMIVNVAAPAAEEEPEVVEEEVEVPEGEEGAPTEDGAVEPEEGSSEEGKS